MQTDQLADIPVVILCGGQGTRIREASEALPKPMIDIGGKPMVWHIMKIYHHFGARRFVLCLGYKAWSIKEYFLNYREQASDLTIFSDGSVESSGDFGREDWTVSLAYTGLESATGRRLHLVRDYLDCDRFMLTYGDGVADVDIGALLTAHEASGNTGTVTAVHPTSRFGELQLDGDSITDFAEKPELHQGLVNGGFFVFEREFLDHVSADSPMLESGALQDLTSQRKLGVYRHLGFWRGMDTYREYTELNGLWDSGQAPWRLWADDASSGPRL
jgi:glucose-1-phosphate cytidylyltransferase